MDPYVPLGVLMAVVSIGLIFFLISLGQRAASNEAIQRSRLRAANGISIISSALLFVSHALLWAGLEDSSPISLVESIQSKIDALVFVILFCTLVFVLIDTWQLRRGYRSMLRDPRFGHFCLV